MGMNLHAIAAPLIGIVNDNVTASWYRSDDYVTNPAGKRGPSYSLMDGALLVQVQALDGDALQQSDSLNIQGIKRSFYASAELRGVDRVAGDGGDVLQFGDTPDVPAPLQGTSWLVTLVVEPWSASGWTHAVGVKQNDPIPLVGVLS